MAVVLVGDNPASEVYVAQQSRRRWPKPACTPFDHQLPESASEAELLALVGKLNADPQVHGILVQLPLPKQIDAQKVIAAIDPDKDVDGFHPLNAGRLASGLPGLVPCTPLGCVMLAKTVLPSLAGLEAVVVGRSNIVGKPLAQLLLGGKRHRDGRPFQDPRSAGGVPPRRYAGRRDRPAGNGARRLDQAGRDGDRRRHQSRAGRGRQVAHRRRRRLSPRPRQVAGAITPVPGGVGPMTIACLLLNTLRGMCAEGHCRRRRFDCHRPRKRAIQ